MYHVNRNHMKAGVAVLISDTIDFRTLLEIKGHFIMTKCLIHQEVTMIINKYTPNNRIPAYVKQKSVESSKKYKI